MESLAKIKQDILTVYDNFKKEQNKEPYSARFHVIWREDPQQTLDTDMRVYMGDDAIEYNINDTDYSYFVTGITELIELVEKNNMDEMESCEFVKFAEFE